MQSEQIANVLGDAAQTVLETMFFTMAEGETEPVFPPEIRLIRVTLDFSGEWPGTFDLRTPIHCARAIAESFAGLEATEEEMSAEKVGEVLCELANMVCGSTLSRLASGKIFDLGVPRLLDGGETLEAAVPNAITVSRGLNLGDGILALAMAIEGVA